MRKKVTNLYKDIFVGLRDYDVNECISKNEDMVVDYEGDRMTIPLDDLTKKMVMKTHVFKSKYDKDYRLYCYTWKPDVVEL